MSPLARWCHRYRLAVVLVWVGVLLALGAGVGAAGSAFGNSPTSQNTDSAKATALLRRASDSAAGKSGRVVWQVDGGRVTDPAAERAMASALDRIADAPGVASVAGPFTAAGRAQVSEDGRTAYATVAFDREVADAQIEHVQDLATAPESKGLHVALNGQAFTVSPAPNPVADAMGIAHRTRPARRGRTPHHPRQRPGRVAHHLLRTDPDRAYEALAHIKDDSRTALDELRATVGLLRQPDDAPGARATIPRLADLDTLVGGIRAGGLPVSVARTGSACPLAPATELSTG